LASESRAPTTALESEAVVDPAKARRRTWQFSLAGVAIAILFDAGYTIWFNPFSGQLDNYRSVAIAVLVGLGILAALASWSTRSGSARATLLGLATAVIGATGFIGLMTIGLPLVAAAICIAVAGAWNFALRPTAATIGLSVVGAALGVGLLLGGLYMTELPVSCGTDVNSSGGGDTWWHGDYSYTCTTGHFTLKTTSR
jgi:hypothetical protein